MFFSSKAAPGETNALAVDEQELESQASQRNSQLQQAQPQRRTSRSASAIIRASIPKAFLVLYFIFSVSIYAILPREAVKVFWFLYLTIGTFLAGITFLEAYDGLSVHALARKSIEKVGLSGWKDDEAKLPTVELIFEGDEADEDRDMSSLQEHLAYPTDKLIVTILPDFGEGDEDLYHHLLHTNRRRISGPPDITGFFRRGETAHPHAARHAVDRLGQKKNPIEIVQSRSVLATQPGKSRWQQIYSSLAALHHDATYGLLHPGSSISWGMSLTNGSALYAKTTTLQSVAERLHKQNLKLSGPAVAFAAHASRTAIAYDLSVITYQSCPTSLLDCLRLHICSAAVTIRTLPYLKLVFIKSEVSSATPEKALENPKPHRTVKQRFAILYALLLHRLCAHAILQYFSLALAMVITNPPATAAEFSWLIFFPFTISIWLIVAGLVCMAGTVAMEHRSASEFAPPGWAFPLILILYPLALLSDALTDVYAQASVILGFS